MRDRTARQWQSTYIYIYIYIYDRIAGLPKSYRYAYIHIYFRFFNLRYLKIWCGAARGASTKSYNSKLIISQAGYYQQAPLPNLKFRKQYFRSRGTTSTRNISQLGTRSDQQRISISEIHALIFICLCMRMHMHMHAHAHACTCICMHMHVHARAYAYACA